MIVIANSERFYIIKNILIDFMRWTLTRQQMRKYWRKIELGRTRFWEENETRSNLIDNNYFLCNLAFSQTDHFLIIAVQFY